MSKVTYSLVTIALFPWIVSLYPCWLLSKVASNSIFLSFWYDFTVNWNRSPGHTLSLSLSFSLYLSVSVSLSSVSLYIYVRVLVCICDECMYIYVYGYVYIFAFICIYLKKKCVRVCVCVYLCMCVSVYIYIYVKNCRKYKPVDRYCILGLEEELAIAFFNIFTNCIAWVFPITRIIV